MKLVKMFLHKMRRFSHAFYYSLILLFSLAACDLRQKIVDIPDNIGDFIASRNPALLAEPDSEIYQYASVLDYGGDHSIYGSPEAEVEYAGAGDYVLYGRKSDYDNAKMTPIKSQTISDVSKDYGTLVVEEKKSFVLNTKKVKVAKGDTAYSIAKKNNMAVERLAVLNKLSAPYTLKIGDELTVESAEIITTKTETTATTAAAPKAPQIAASAPVIKSNANIKLPKLDARTSAKFSWPVRGKIIASFGPTRSGLNNDGINIAAPAGTTVAAAENGNVAYAGNEMKGYGNLLIIQHAGGWMTIYGHLGNFIVRRGDKVSVGQKIGSVGSTGKVSEPQLHFEIRKGSKAYDPKKQLK